MPSDYWIIQDLKKRKKNIIENLEKQIEEAETELQKVRSQMERNEKLIQEKRKILGVAYHLPDDMSGSPRSPLILDHDEAEQGNQTSKKLARRTKSNSSPRFMALTECSRQRQKTAKLMIRWRDISVMNRKSMDFIGSQSLSFSTLDNPISLQMPKKRTMISYKRKQMSSHSKPEEVSHNSIDSKGIFLIKNKQARYF